MKIYKWERKVALNRIASGVCSLPRVAAAAKVLPPLGMLPGASLDLTVHQEDGAPKDFDIKSNRGKARALYGKQ